MKKFIFILITAALTTHAASFAYADADPSRSG